MAAMDEARALAATMTDWRHDLHRHPELGYEETRTSALVAERLTSFGLEVTKGLGRTGVVGTLVGSEPARSDEGPKAIGLRADMDALPMAEEGDSDHRSTVPGAFHGCGHDGHTTMLLGAAAALAKAPKFAGKVHFIFQPAEEGLAGAKAMMDDGLFERFPCDEVYGMHNWPQEELGKVCVRSGPMMAASDRIDIVVSGKGSHAAMPHRGIDTVYVASQIINGLQSLVSRAVDPVDAAVVSITKIEAGSTFNVIPQTATLGGTCRTFRPETRDAMERGIERIATGIAEAHGATAKVVYTRGYPPTINHDIQTGHAAEAAARIVGKDNVFSDREPCMGGEDFAFMLEDVPGSYVWLGQGGDYDLHHPKYDFNDEALPLGASYWVSLVETRLG